MFHVFCATLRLEMQNPSGAWRDPVFGFFGAAAEGQLHLTFSASSASNLVDIC